MLLQTKFEEDHPSLSPDGRWVAYSSDRVGREEVYIARFPEMTSNQRVSVDGGWAPLWTSDDEIVFRSLDNRRVYAVPLETASSLKIGAPSLLIEGPYAVEPFPHFRNYDVTPDGEHFFIERTAPVSRPENPPQLVLAQNWSHELLELVGP